MTGWKNIGIILTAVLALVALAAKVGNLDARYAKAEEVVQIAKRLDNKIIQDRMEKLQERMWAMEDRWAERFFNEKNRTHDTLDELLHFMTEEARNHYRELQREYEKLERELKEQENEETE
jgi:hypothetical protein